MIKRICVLILSLITAISFVACGGEDSTSESSKNESNSIESESSSIESSSTGGNAGGDVGSDTGGNEGGTGEGQTPAPTTYTVTFDSDGGSTVESVTVKSGEKITEPTAPSKSSQLYEYEFDGWYLGDKEWNFETDVVTESITLVAKWKQNGSYTKPFLPKT